MMMSTQCDPCLIAQGCTAMLVQVLCADHATLAGIRWYGPGEPKKVYIERKTHRESWKGEESVKERISINDEKVVPFCNQVRQGEGGCMGRVCGVHCI